MSRADRSAAAPRTAPEPVGPSYSRPRATSGTRSGTYEAGIDTVRFLFRLHDRRQQRHAEEFLQRPRPLAGAMTVGYLPALEMLWAEGRPATLLWGDDHRLLPAGALPDAGTAAKLALGEHGYTDARQIGLSRVDIAAGRRRDRPAEGWGVLRGLAALEVPRRKPDVIGRPPETVYWLTEGGAKRERAYDKGRESSTAPAGTKLRLEAQNRFRSPERTTAEWWSMERVRETFERRFGPMARGAGHLHVANERVIRERVRDLVAAKRMTPRAAELLLGYLAAESVGIPSNSRRTRFRRRAELRRIGLALALDGIDDPEPLDVDLGELLADALTASAWTTA